MSKTRKEIGDLIAKLKKEREERDEKVVGALTRAVLKNEKLLDQLDELSKTELQEVARRMADGLGAIIAEVRAGSADAVPAQPDQRQFGSTNEVAAASDN